VASAAEAHPSIVGWDYLVSRMGRYERAAPCQRRVMRARYRVSSNGTSAVGWSARPRRFAGLPSVADRRRSSACSYRWVPFDRTRRRLPLPSSRAFERMWNPTAGLATLTAGPALPILTSVTYRRLPV